MLPKSLRNRTPFPLSRNVGVALTSLDVSRLVASQAEYYFLKISHARQNLSTHLDFTHTFNV